MLLTDGNVQPAARESAVAQSSAYKTMKWLNDQPILFLVSCLAPHLACIKLSVSGFLLHVGREIENRPIIAVLRLSTFH